ncbi:response regulator transcription factor [Sphingobacterium griseoflavum]|uniref:Helix-turn-helix transcriptional regulator n=1 Tax=Sphingobacterium griseoflavum TaxID=1474952 RepID=A0ABQ3I0C2_9SPHI|nr:helix-turn-helix transcriptional regulator [Sphingobacterium griseoflavum]GHE42119.1 helix-turn-helix transcriptional regulator [Sphingobacterium griseoflavum]
MDPIAKLENKFLFESFDSPEQREEALKEALQAMESYVKIDNAVAVLSDLASNRSYIFAGNFGAFFKMHTSGFTTIDSIWEDQIYHRIHPDDLFQRHLLELEFFNFLKLLSPAERLNYATKCRIRALNDNEDYQYIMHRSFYMKNSSVGGLWLGVCLYNYLQEKAPPSQTIEGAIINTKTGEQFYVDTYVNCTNLLTLREKEVLLLIGRGVISKEIAAKLHISINTVHRHRQNILKKLNVNNSMEAVRTAEALALI